eukprot:TRINITY_DN6017_c0_g1_i2.p1 TRINITY_DN6017_c0_g1~~TRINITY_DN6017_c0_g1_i2.p1  ORF type:complete len:624 (+),score=119.05 TRINITY_DN6017_c0_g1_i2:143-2014(+)
MASEVPAGADAAFSAEGVPKVPAIMGKFWERKNMVPYGVNLGGWFCLEDWFYSDATGPHKGHCVKTPEPGYDAKAKAIKTEDYVASVELMFEGLTSAEKAQLRRKRFGCESDLVNLLLDSGLSNERVVDLFLQHRRTYITPTDFARIRAMGIRKVRLPLTWCLSYDKPYLIRGKDWDGKDTSAVVKPGAGIVNDPFTNDAAFNPSGMKAQCDKWMAIPISAVEHILETAADFGLEVLLDIHAFPGGSAAGTFNGIWPWNPRFWSAHAMENFKTIIGNLLDWMASLATSNPKAFRGLHGMTPMNEPAHCRGLYDSKGLGVPSTYDVAGRPMWADQVKAMDVLMVLETCVSEFRKHTVLVESGKRLLMNVIETAFNEAFGKADSTSFGASQTKDGGMDRVYQAIGDWWKNCTTAEDRTQWAVLDIHNYIAWNPSCSRFAEIKSDSELYSLYKELSAPFFVMLRSRLGMPKPELLATSEYSASTHQDTLLSITSGVGPTPDKHPGRAGGYAFDWLSARDAFIVAQHRWAEVHSIDMWFWTYHIRKNVNYQGEWSLQHILSPTLRYQQLRQRYSGPEDDAELSAEAYESVMFFCSMVWHLICAIMKAPFKRLFSEGCGRCFAFNAAS